MKVLVFTFLVFASLASFASENQASDCPRTLDSQDRSAEDVGASSDAQAPVSSTSVSGQ